MGPCKPHAHSADALPCVLILLALIASHEVEVFMLISDDVPHLSAGSAIADDLAHSSAHALDLLKTPYMVG